VEEMNGENKDLINNKIDEGEEARIKVLISALRDTATDLLVKKDIIGYLLDSYESLTRNDAQFVIDKANEISSASGTPKKVIVKICVMLKKFRGKESESDDTPSSINDNIISVDVPDH
jgi:hypothetical protein